MNVSHSLLVFVFSLHNTSAAANKMSKNSKVGLEEPKWKVPELKVYVKSYRYHLVWRVESYATFYIDAHSGGILDWRSNVVVDPCPLLPPTISDVKVEAGPNTPKTVTLVQLSS